MNALRNYSFLTFFLIITCQGAQAQLRQFSRFEEEVKTSEAGFTVISMKKEGLALIRDMVRHAQGKKKWQLEIVDTTLTKIWSTEIELENRLVLVGYEYNPGHVYFLFREGESDFYNFQLLTVSFLDKVIQTDKIKFDVEFKISHFTMAGKSAVFGGYVSNEPAVLLYDQTRDHPKVLPGLFIADVALLDVRANQNQSFNVLLAERKGKERRKLVVRTYDQEGNMLLEDEMETDPKYSILTGITSSLERDEMIVVGTYADATARPARGFYSAIIDPFNNQPITYSDFPSLDHFLDYLPAKKAGKIKEKASQQKLMGEQPDFSVNVSMIRLEERPSGFYALAEVYYSSTQYTSWNSYNNPYSYGYDPYGARTYPGRYYNNTPSQTPYSSPIRSDVHVMATSVVHFDNQGRVKKDYCMKLDNIRIQGLEQVGDFVDAPDSIVMTYKKEDEIVYQLATGDAKEVPLTRKLPVKLTHSKDVLRNENDSEGSIRYWYDKHFYIWGYQTIKDISRLDGEKTRHVFYVNRISLD